jgi:hypothetical protein
MIRWGHEATPQHDDRLGHPFDPVLGFEKEDLLTRYRNKFVVVIREGLAIGVCEGHPATRGLLGEQIPSATITVDGDQADMRGHDFIAPSGCGRVTTEPVRKGEVLAVRHVAIHSGQLMINVENVSLHAIERGVGAMGHETFERGSAFIKFKLPSGKNYDAALAVVENWMKPFDSHEEAAQFGNTASGAFVPRDDLCRRGGSAGATDNERLTLPRRFFTSTKI